MMEFYELYPEIKDYANKNKTPIIMVYGAEDHTVVVTVRVTIPVENMGNSVNFTADIIWDLALAGV